MSDTVTLALIALVGPLLMALLIDWQAKRRRTEDYARQDRVAATAAENAKALLEVNKQNGTTLKVIHKLVNSNLTAAVQGRLDALKTGLILLLENAELKKTAFGPYSGSDAQIMASRSAIAALEADLAAREEQNRTVTDADNVQMEKDLRGPQEDLVVKAVEDNTAKSVEVGRANVAASEKIADAIIGRR